VAAEDVGGLPGAADAGGDADGGVAVGPHDAAGHVEDVIDVDVGYSTGGVDAAEEADLGAVLVADPGEVALFEECLADGGGGVGEDASTGLLPAAGGPLLPEDVGAEVADLFVVVVGGEHADESEGVADDLDGPGVGEVEDDAGGVAGSAPPVADAVDGPGALHLEVGVQDPVAELHEEVFAVGPDAVDEFAGEVGEGDGGDAQGGVEDLPAGHELQAPGELEYGVTFGHVFTLHPAGRGPRPRPAEGNPPGRKYGE